MKNLKILFTALFFIILGSCFSQHGEWQTVALEDRFDIEFKNRRFTYFKDLNGTYNKFIGTWIYNQGPHYFKITFFKIENQDEWAANTQTSDQIHSNYEYRLNNILMFDSYNQSLSFVNSYSLKNSTILNLFYQEPSLISCEKARMGDLTVTFSLNSNNQPVLNWTRIDKPVLYHPIPCENGTEPDTSDFLAPANMVLMKQ